MRQVLCIFVALLCAEAFAGVDRWADRLKAGPIDPMQSAALFVGVRNFTEDSSLTPVPYAVDDAVDLAYELAMNRQPALIDPKRVVLALSGEPQKPESQEKLRKLLAAGASTHAAGQSDVFNLLESQSRAVGRDGIFIAAFATHALVKRERSTCWPQPRSSLTIARPVLRTLESATSCRAMAFRAR